MTIAETLRAALAKIEDGWCHGAYARDKMGKAVMPRHPSAVRWCMYGAICAVNKGGVSERIHSILNRVTAPLNFVTWQDHPERTKTDIVNAFKRAISIVEK